ncbi:natterin-4 [Cuculus canorus]|uniref:natterin-4 n=1 Tax=Cuculus canorus TaxID=55661 RepID=UPI0023AB55CC|nr:natterin-4 [Cuculus canorus]
MSAASGYFFPSFCLYLPFFFSLCPLPGSARARKNRFPLRRDPKKGRNRPKNNKRGTQKGFGAAVGMVGREVLLGAVLVFLSRGSGGDAVAAVGMVRRSLRPSAPKWTSVRRKREEEPPSYLKWVTFEGGSPADAVSSWNAYAERTEFVCSTSHPQCNVGAYVPSRGPFCFYPYAGWERRTQSFKILVNVGGLEALAWVDDSFGSVPDAAVEGCPSVDVFVGRNRYGLGKVAKEHRAAFMMVDGEEVWFKWYQVLVVKKGLAAVTISHVHYNTSGAVERWEKVTLMKTTVRNEGCGAALKEVTLEEATEVEHRWAMDQRIFATVRGVLRAPLLTFNGTTWGVTNATTISWLGGASAGEYLVHRHVVEKTLQPRTACEVALEGQRGDVHVPFTARLTRDFGDAQPHRVAVRGWAHSRAVVAVQADVRQCWSLTHGPPCRG